MLAASRQKAGTIAWILLVLISLVLIGIGTLRAGWHLGLPAPAQQEESWIGRRFVYAGCALSFAAALWSYIRGNQVWVSVCVGIPGALVGWAALDNPYDLKRFVAAAVAFPLALAGIAEVIRVRGRRQRE